MLSTEIMRVYLYKHFCRTLILNPFTNLIHTTLQANEALLRMAEQLQESAAAEVEVPGANWMITTILVNSRLSICKQIHISIVLIYNTQQGLE